MPDTTYINRWLSSWRWETQWNLLDIHVTVLSERSLEGMRRFDRVFISFTESLSAFNESMFCSLSYIDYSLSSDLFSVCWPSNLSSKQMNHGFYWSFYSLFWPLTGSISNSAFFHLKKYSSPTLSMDLIWFFSCSLMVNSKWTCIL